ncbi:hypothetical protein [Actinophytocola sp.]|uniref:hypothetical protein n=1 Tax=Actinophytocola sp. TaxID=1872138 RepID=UPI002D7FFA17|nr:hypothetical protein [Actinophytocola sp.]HET9138147.1 hypothetical protein [Actinophytocola sp.]
MDGIDAQTRTTGNARSNTTGGTTVRAGGTAADVTAGQPTYLQAMPLHAITEVYGERGLRDRWALETQRLPLDAQCTLAEALDWASDLHAGQRRVREPVVNHLLRVALRILCYYRVTDTAVLAAALLHDSVEDQPGRWPVGPARGPTPAGPTPAGTTPAGTTQRLTLPAHRSPRALRTRRSLRRRATRRWRHWPAGSARR